MFLYILSFLFFCVCYKLTASGRKKNALIYGGLFHHSCHCAYMLCIVTILNRLGKYKFQASLLVYITIILSIIWNISQITRWEKKTHKKTGSMPRLWLCLGSLVMTMTVGFSHTSQPKHGDIPVTQPLSSQRTAMWFPHCSGNRRTLWAWITLGKKATAEDASSIAPSNT